ncbi:MAG: hypothetical protein KJ006_09790 [Thermoleophilia bacterium]|nr:hypothetical protein [Thermoleophilia bacterium]
MRATLRGGDLTLVPRRFATVTGGPIACLARAALPTDAAVADLSFCPAEHEDDDHEGESVEEDDDQEDGGGADRARTVEVRFIANDGPVARRELRRWAARTGHERIWFRDEVLELEPPPGVDGEYGTTCPSCGLAITDSGPALVSFVRKVGHFPLNCFVCGAFAPQWTPVSDSYAADDRDGYDEPAAPRVLHVVGDREAAGS